MGAKCAFAVERVRSHDIAVMAVDVGVLRVPQLQPDISADEAAALTGTNREELAQTGGRGRAVTTVDDAASALVRRPSCSGS